MFSQEESPSSFRLRSSSLISLLILSTIRFRISITLWYDGVFLFYRRSLVTFRPDIRLSLVSISADRFYVFLLLDAQFSYGVGYYSPVECNHLDIPCEYVKYPNFDMLATKLANVDNSWVPGMTNEPVDDASFAASLPVCPAGIAPISTFEWAADDEPDLPCYVIETEAPSETPTESPTQVPTVAGQPTNKPIFDFALPTETPTPPPGSSSCGRIHLSLPFQVIAGIGMALQLVVFQFV